MNGASHELFNIKLRTCLDTGHIAMVNMIILFRSYEQKKD